MKTTIHQRFEIVIDRLGISKNKFAKELGVASTQIYNIINGRNAPSFDLMVKIASTFPAVNMTWLLVEKGPILNGNQAVTVEGTQLLGKIKSIEDQLAKLSEKVDGKNKEDETITAIKELLAKKD